MTIKSINYRLYRYIYESIPPWRFLLPVISSSVAKATSAFPYKNIQIRVEIFVLI